MRYSGVARRRAWSGASCDSPVWVKPVVSGPSRSGSIPKLVRLRLDTAFTARGERANWSVDDARPDAIVAVNVGQFIRTLPWGWVVLDGREFLTPGRGPLSTAVAVDSSGSVRWIGPDGLANPAVRRGVVAAFQSYPTLLTANGEVPAALREPGRGIDVEHRDARLGIGELADGRLLIVLTRFDALGASLGVLPFGPTIPEFAALMGALGARQAVALDGGISGQLLVRDADGTDHAWRGMRKVPMALVAASALGRFTEHRHSAPAAPSSQHEHPATSLSAPLVFQQVVIDFPLRDLRDVVPPFLPLRLEEVRRHVRA